MFEKMITGLFMGTDGTVKIMNVGDELKNWYELLNCQCIDIIIRKIDTVKCAIICDDEGLLKDCPVPTVFGAEGNAERIYGNVFICDINAGDGELASLKDEDMCRILRSLVVVNSTKDPDCRIGMADLDYVG